MVPILGRLWGAMRYGSGTGTEMTGTANGASYPETWIGLAHVVPGKWLALSPSAEQPMASWNGIESSMRVP